jgi:hypothetical protein
MSQTTTAPSTAFKILDEWYRGEVWGEAAFLALAAEAGNGVAAAKWRVLAALECATRERIGASIRALDGIQPTIEPQPDLTPTRIAELTATPWPDLMRWVERMAADALDVMTRDAAALPATLEPTVTWVLDHERALLDFARHELSGDGMRSLDRAHDMLAMTEHLRG